MDCPKISVKKDRELFPTPTRSGGTKRPSSYEDDGTNVKRNRCDEDVQEVVVKSEYHPITSLTPELTSPLIRGKVTSISPWCTYAGRKVTCMNFRLEDESGGIHGVVYAPMSKDFMKDFRPKAEVIIEHVKVQRLRQEFRTSKDQLQIVVNKWTKIRIIAAPPEPVETSASAIDTSEALKPVDRSLPKPCWTSPNPGVITVQQSSFSSPGFRITVHTPPSTLFVPINAASGSRSEYPVANAPAALPTLSGTSSIAASPGTVSDRFASVREVFSNGAFPDDGPLSSINEIQSKARVGTTIDIIGLAVQVGDSKSQLTRKGYTATVREVTLRDDTCSEIKLAIWGPDNSIIPANSVLLVKKATVILYKETKQLTCIRGSVIVDPDIPEAHRLENLVACLPIVAETVRPRVAEVKTSFEVSENKVPPIHSNLCSISEVQSKITVGTTIDVIGLVVQVGDPRTRMTRRGQTASVREVTLRDNLCSEINLAIWESEGDRSYIQVNSVLVVNNAKLILYNDKKQLTCLRACVSVDPDIPEAHRLKNLPRSVPVVTEKVRAPVALAAGTSSDISSIEVPLVTGPLSSINKIHSEIAVGTKVDLIGFAVRVEEPISRITRKGNAAFLREVTLKDDSDSQINLAIWEAGRESSQILPNSVLLVKNATVIVYNQVKKLTCQRVCVSIDPDISQAHRLKKQIEDAKLQTQKIETLVPPDTTEISAQMWMRIDETLHESKTDKIPDEVTADIPAAHRNFPRSVSAEKARSPVTVAAGRISNTSSNEVPQVNFNLCPIDRIHSEIAVETKIDLIGLTVRVEEPKSQTTPKGYDVVLREVTLRDDSCAEIDVAIWESREDSSPIPFNSVLLVKNATVIVYNQVKKLSCQRFCVSIDPDISQAHRLKQQIKDVKPQTTKTVTLVPPEATDNSAQMKMRIVETPEESKTDKITDEVSADTLEAHRLKNLPRSVSVVTEKARATVGVTTGRSSDISSYEVPQVVLNLCPINRIHSEIALETKVDLIGLAVRVEEAKSRMTRKGYDAFLREVTLRDDSCSEIDVAIWEAGQDSSPIIPNSVLLVKNATVIVYNQVKKLTCQRICVSIDPDISQAHRLKKHIEDVKPQTQKTETLIPADATHSSAHIKMRIDETPEESKTDKIRNGVSADIPEAHRLKSVPRSFSIDSETARAPVAVAAATSSHISSYEVPQVTLNLYPINRIHSEIAMETTIDLIGCVMRMEVPKSRMTRKGNPAILTEVILKDDSGSQINVAIWEAGTESSPILLNSVLLVKNATVLVYNNVKKLSCQRVCVSIDPDIPQTYILKKQIKDGQVEETQKIEPDISPDATDDSKPVNTTIGETPKASKTESKHTPIDTTPDESKAESFGNRVDVLGVTPHEDPVQYLVKDNEGIPETHGLKNFPRSAPVVTEKAQLMVGTVAGTSYDISSNEVPLVTDNLYPIKRIHSEIAVGTKVDLIGLVVRVEEPKSRTTRKGYDAFVTEVTLKDDSFSEIDVAVWEARKDSSSIPLNSVLLVKNAAVILYKEQKKLTCQRVWVSIDPDIPRARELKKKIEDATRETQTDISALKERTIESSTGQAKNRYTPIDKIQDVLSAGMNVNILGIVTHRDPVEHLVKNDKDNYKAAMVIVDQTRRKITMTVWGPRALTLSDEQYWIVEGLNIRVHEYNGEKQLTCTERLSTLNTEPNIEEAKELRQWLSDVWLKAEESYAAAVADYKSNSEKNVENERIPRLVLPVPTSPELATYTPIDLVYQRVPKGSRINILGIADWVQPLRTIRKLNRTVYMREINILDDSRKSIWVTIWGDKALIDTMCHNVVAIINATVRVNNNVKDIVCSEEESSLFFVNPCMERTRELLDWYKINAVDNIFVETIMPITPNNLVFSTFQSGEKTSVIGVIVKIYESQYVEGQTARLDVCRRIELIDDSEETINLLMWGEPARDFNLLEGTILLVTNVRVFVKDQYKACVSSAWSHFVVDPIAPDIRDKVKRIRLWWCGHKMRQPQCQANTLAAPAGDSKNLMAIIKNEPIAGVDDCNESARAEPMDNSNIDENVANPTDNPNIDENVANPTDNSNIDETAGEPTDHSNVDESAAEPIAQPDMDEDQLQEYLGEERQRWSSKLNRAGSSDEVYASARIPEAGGRRIPGLLGSLVSLVSTDRAIRLHEHVDKLHRELGAIYRDRVGPVDAIFLNSPDDFQKIFRLEGRTPAHFLPEAWMLYNEIRQCSRGLLFMSGEEWLNFRRIMNRVMLTPDPSVTMSRPCEKAARDLVDGWKRFADNSQTVPELETRLYRWSIEVMLATLTGSSWQVYKARVDKETVDLARILHKIFSLSAKLSLLPTKLAIRLGLPVWREFCTVADEALRIVRELVPEMARLEGDGMLSSMKKEGITDERDLVRIVTDLVIAAGDTTAFSTLWSLLLLAQNPSVQEKLYERIKNSDQKDILADHFIKAIIKESLRLYPTAPFLTRFMPEDSVIAGYHVPKHKLIIMSIYSSGRDPKNFPEPNEFRPERWMRNGRGSYEGVNNPHGSLPFALGARSCVGRKLAETQMILTLSEIVKNFRIECQNSARVKMILHLISVPSEPLKLKLHTR